MKNLNKRGDQMADDKKYYYLKVKENFFDSEQMIVLESMQDGHLYSNILLKLYLRSLKNEGKLMFNERIPYNSTILAQVVRHSVGVVEKAIGLFKEFGLIDILDNGAIYMLDIQNYIGKSSSEADRQREYQLRINNDKGMLQLEPCKKSNKKSNIKSTPEIELEKDKEIEKDIYSTFTSNSDLLQTLYDFDKMRSLLKNGKMTDKARSLMLSELNKLADTDAKKIAILEQSILNNWKGVFPLKTSQNTVQNKAPTKPTFSNFKNREYDANDLEAKLLAATGKELNFNSEKP
jgi:predicted phage replisome organizer